MTPLVVLALALLAIAVGAVVVAVRELVRAIGKLISAVSSTGERLGTLVNDLAADTAVTATEVGHLRSGLEEVGRPRSPRG